MCVLCMYVCVRLYVSVTVGVRGIPEISGIARLPAERRQKVYRSEVCVKCQYFTCTVRFFRR